MYSQIKRDVTRTYPKFEFFKNIYNQNQLLNILVAVVKMLNDTGYIQGMNFLAASI